MDILIHDSGLFIRHELVLAIRHCLLVREGTKPERIKVIYSHPQALGQCRAYLQKSFPEADLVASLSTSAAVSDMLKSESTAAAIASERAASLHGAAVLARGVEDDPSNVTRFVVLGATEHPPTGFDKTSVCFSFDQDIPGQLHGVMRELSERDINMTKIESRPTRKSLGQYFFLVDLEGHHLDAKVGEALDEVMKRVTLFKSFGSYPRYAPTRVTTDEAPA